MAIKLVKIFQSNHKYSAEVDNGPRFEVGKRVTYQGDVGVTNDGSGKGYRYDPMQFPAEGHWAPFIFPTSKAESDAFMTNVNTYDSARFTFGFFQFAAHVPDGDFVRFLRQLIALPSGADYFPDLVVKNGRIHRDTETGLKRLEDDESTQGLMNYLNPDSSEVQDIEVINAAKLMDGAATQKEQRDLQVSESVHTAKEIMRVSSKRYGLDGMIDTVCLVIMDIRHHGRGGSQSIINALSSANTEDKKLRNLLQIGATTYPERIATLKKEMKALADAGVLGVKRYDQVTGDFN
jgi:hypothetical protein